MNNSITDKLVSLYHTWLTNNNIKPMSADEVLAEHRAETIKLTAKQLRFLHNFIELWDTEVHYA